MSVHSTDLTYLLCCTFQCSSLPQVIQKQNKTRSQFITTFPCEGRNTLGFAASLIQVQISALPLPPGVILASLQTSMSLSFHICTTGSPAAASPPRPRERKCARAPHGVWHQLGLNTLPLALWFFGAGPKEAISMVDRVQPCSRTAGVLIPTQPFPAAWPQRRCLTSVPQFPHVQKAGTVPPPQRALQGSEWGRRGGSTQHPQPPLVSTPYLTVTLLFTVTEDFPCVISLDPPSPPGDRRGGCRW